MPAEFFQPVVRPLVGVVELLERLDQERAAAAGGVEQLDGRQLVLPGVPEADEGRPLGGVERVEVVDARVGEHAAGGALGLLGVLAAERLEAVLQDAAEGLADDVARDERRRVERPFLLAAAGVLFRVEPLGQPVQLVAEPLQVGDRLLEDVAEDVDVHELGVGRLGVRRPPRAAAGSRRRRGPGSSGTPRRGRSSRSRSGSSANRPPL